MLQKTFKLFLLLNFILIVFFTINMWRVHAFSKIYNERKSDAAIVLGAGTNNAKLSPIFKERMNHAIDLIHRQKVDYLILTGGFGEGQNISDSKAAKKYAIKNGVEEKFILIEEKSRITFYNIINAKKLMEEYQLKTALLVSDPYHMKRAIVMSKDIGLDILSSPTPSTMYQTKKTKRKFLLNQTWNYCLYILFGKFRKAEMNQ